MKQDRVTTQGYSKENPFIGRVKSIQNLNEAYSNKQTFHIEISCDAPLSYDCGDAIGILMPDVPHTSEATPRLYSISSSPSYHGNEIHMTVALAIYKNPDGSINFGVYSHYLANLKQGDEVAFFIEQNPFFSLPDDDTDIIMIGPGTGIAPFRSFIYERARRQASGRNWLFFGDQRARYDFIYKEEWDRHIKEDVLYKLDTAFSRDQDEKLYVQDRLRENAKEIMTWIENGAVIYICGSKSPMCDDVEKALCEIIEEYTHTSYPKAVSYLKALEEQKRLLKDVY